MTIGVLGSGMVGQQLSLGLIRQGHKVIIGTRNPSKLDDWIKDAGKDGSTGSFKEAAEKGEIIFLCTLWAGTLNAIEMAGVENFSGKVVVDVTNPLDFSKGVPPAFVAEQGKSGGEIIQQFLPEAKVVKALNIINAYKMVNPVLEEGKPDMFVAGNDEEAKKKVIAICEAWGWENVIDMGDISEAYWLETLAMLWIHYAFKHGGWGHGFKLLRK